MKTWPMVRLPTDLAGRLDRLAREMERSHQEGRSQLPNEFVEHVPLHHVIGRALDEMEAHRERSRRPRKAVHHG